MRGLRNHMLDKRSNLTLAPPATQAMGKYKPHGRKDVGHPIARPQVDPQSPSNECAFNPRQVPHRDAIAATTADVQSLPGMPSVLGADRHGCDVDRIANQQGLSHRQHRRAHERPPSITAIGPIEGDDAIGESLGQIETPPRDTTAKGHDEVAVRFAAETGLEQPRNILECPLGEPAESTGPITAGQHASSEHEAVTPHRSSAGLCDPLLWTQEAVRVQPCLTSVRKRLLEAGGAAVLHLLHGTIHGVQRQRNGARLPSKTK